MGDTDMHTQNTESLLEEAERFERRWIPVLMVVTGVTSVMAIGALLIHWFRDVPTTF